MIIMNRPMIIIINNNNNNIIIIIAVAFFRSHLELEAASVTNGP
jgi:hypothetical protein